MQDFLDKLGNFSIKSPLKEIVQTQDALIVSLQVALSPEFITRRGQSMNNLTFAYSSSLFDFKWFQLLEE